MEATQPGGVSFSNATEPKDIFLHLLAIVTLYASAISFLVLLFQYVNLLIPDLLQGVGYYALESARGSMRWAIASLIVVFPVYITTMWFLGNAYARNPSKRSLRIRKWLIYFTLFITALTVIGDLVTLVYTFLQGDLTTQFILKVLAVLFTAGSIFVYYFWDLRKYRID